MKILHRTKAIEAYNGARCVLKEGMAYPAYMMFKEAARGVLSYMVEDSFNREICEKTKLERLMELVDTELLTSEQIDCVKLLIDTESKGLSGILAMDLDELYRVKKAIKKLIATYLKEPV